MDKNGLGTDHRRALRIAADKGEVTPRDVSWKAWTEEERRRHPYLKEGRETLKPRRALGVLEELLVAGLLVCRDERTKSGAEDVYVLTDAGRAAAGGA